MYYGLFVKVDKRWLRVDTTTGYTLETARVKFLPLVLALRGKGIEPEFRLLRPVKAIDPYVADKKYAKTPW
jgi:hypothetical protein